MAVAKKPTAAQPAKEYLYVVMATHPVHGTKVPVNTYETEEEAYKAAAVGNADPRLQHLGYHVKKVVKGGA